jgi:hypothetical protein
MTTGRVTSRRLHEVCSSTFSKGNKRWNSKAERLYFMVLNSPPDLSAKLQDIVAAVSDALRVK